MTQMTSYQQLRQIDYAIRRLAISDDPSITTAAWRSYEVLKRSMRAALDRMRDYELSAAEQDTTLQVKTLPQAIKALVKLRESLLKASEYELVSAVDVALISSQLDDLIDRLK